MGEGLSSDHWSIQRSQQECSRMFDIEIRRLVGLEGSKKNAGSPVPKTYKENSGDHKK